VITETSEADGAQTATAECVVLGVISTLAGDLAAVFDAILAKAHTLCERRVEPCFSSMRTTFRADAVHCLPGRNLRAGYALGAELRETSCLCTATLRPLGWFTIIVDLTQVRRSEARGRRRAGGSGPI